MATYLLTWNPDSWRWADLKDDVAAVRRGDAHELRWSCGNTKSIKVGSRVFLLRQGVEPRGVIASGWVTKPTYQHQHWDPHRAKDGDKANFVAFAVDTIIDPEESAPLDVRKFQSPVLRQVNWATPASGIKLSESAATELEELWAAYMPKGRSDLGAAPFDIVAVEGKLSRRLVKHRSRERALRVAKIRATLESTRDGRLRCEVPGCAFDFEATYGPIGKGYAQVHHLRPLGDSDEAVETTLEDLAVVCANCHAMIHRGGATRSIGRLIRSLRR